MKLEPSIAGVFVAAFLAGVLCGEFTAMSKQLWPCDWTRQITRPVHGAGIYEADVERAMQEAVNRGVVSDSEQTGEEINRRSVLDFIALPTL